MTGDRNTRPWRPFVVATLALGLALSGCEPPRGPAPPQGLPPAYTSNQITDPTLRKAAEEIRAWTAKQTGDGGRPLYGKVEILPVALTVQPYGVGVYQQEPRLPVILTTGPGWAGMSSKDKESRVADAFHHIAGRLKALGGDPVLQPTLTIQTSEGLELAWINHLDASGRNVHGDD